MDNKEIRIIDFSRSALERNVEIEMISHAKIQTNNIWRFEDNHKCM